MSNSQQQKGLELQDQYLIPQATEQADVITIESLLKKLEGKYSQQHLQLIKKVYEFSKKAHEGQYRKSGLLYISHPLAVTNILADLNLDFATLATGLLHDTVEDTSVTLDDIFKNFGKDIADLVDGVTKISQITFQNTHTKQGENIRKMFVAMAKDLRVIVVKLADRLHNVRTLNYMSYEKQLAIAQETLDIYAPLANRLGINSWQIELEDLSFKYLKPNNFQDLTEKFSNTKKEKGQFIKNMLSILSDEIKKQAKLIPIVQGRHKHLYSIYQKMSKKNIDYDAIYDVFGFRIIADTKTQCYEMLGIIHNMYRPIPGRFKDYIAIPKPNHYQSLHTTVMTTEGDRVEVQIRTQEMHLVAEKGIAAHWSYKLGETITSNTKKFEWIKDLMDWNKETYDPNEFLENIKSDLLESEIYIFTPKGDIKALKEGATALDFAYSIHTEVGHHTVSAKIDGQIVPLKHKLQNGDTVQIMTSPHQKPSKNWLEYSTTSSAKSKIRNFIHIEERKQSIELGRQLLEKEFKKYGFKLEKYINTERAKKYLDSIGTHTKEFLYAQVAYGKRTPNKVLARLNPQFQKLQEQEKKDLKQSVIQDPSNKAKKGKDHSLIQVNGMTDLLLHYAKCCQPIHGDAIVGFISRGRGLVIHQMSCPKIFELEPERRINVGWVNTPHTKLMTQLRVVCHDFPGLLKLISEAFTLKGINIESAEVKTHKNKKAICTFVVEVTNRSQLIEALKSLEKVNGVIHAERAFFKERRTS